MTRTLLAALSLLALPFSATAHPREQPLRATEVLWVADDFVVELWHNGEPVPLERRELVNEIFGATVERARLALRAGDWLCFHVVANRMRWGGCRFFAAAGRLAAGEFLFASDPVSPCWSACDDPSHAAEFVARARTRNEQRARTIDKPWDQGEPSMRELAGADCGAKPLWGEAASTWLKVRIE
jgi:hypothetical protein